MSSGRRRKSESSRKKYTKLSGTETERFLELIISEGRKKGVSIPQAAQEVGISQRSAYNLKDRLIAEGRIIAIGKSPAVFEKAKPEIKQDPDDCSLHGGCAELDGDGIYIGKDDPPEGFARIHFSGSVTANVTAEGDMEDLRDARGIVYGYWSAFIGHPNGCEERRCTFNNLGQSITMAYRKGNRGSRTIRFGLGEIWADPMMFGTPKDVFNVFLKRIQFTISVLEQHGWGIGNDIEFKGDIHMAWPGHSWGPALVNRVYDRTDSSIVADRSPGVLEVEIENASEQSGLDNAKVLAHAPEIILSQSSELTEHGLAIERAEARMDSLSEDASAIKQRIAGLNSELLGMIGTLGHIRTALNMTVENSELLVKNAMLTQQLNASQYGISNGFSQRPDETEPRLEGYQ